MGEGDDKNAIFEGFPMQHQHEIYTKMKCGDEHHFWNNDEIIIFVHITPSKTTKTDEKNLIVKINKQNKIDRNLKTEGVDLANILENPRTRKKLLDSLNP